VPLVEILQGYMVLTICFGRFRLLLQSSMSLFR
jgi:hypothetical protein